MTSPVNRRQALALLGAAAASIPSVAAALPSLPSPAQEMLVSGALPPGPFLVAARSTRILGDGRWQMMTHGMEVIGRARRYTIAGEPDRHYIRIYPAYHLETDEMFLYDRFRYVAAANRVNSPKAIVLAAGYNMCMVYPDTHIWHWRSHGKTSKFLHRGHEAINLVPASAFAEVRTRGQSTDMDDSLRYRAMRAANHYDDDITRWSWQAR